MVVVNWTVSIVALAVWNFDHLRTCSIACRIQNHQYSEGRSMDSFVDSFYWPTSFDNRVGRLGRRSGEILDLEVNLWNCHSYSGDPGHSFGVFVSACGYVWVGWGGHE